MSDTTISEAALWMQAGSYPARLDRRLIDAVWASEGIVRGLTVGPRGAGANLSVDVAPGLAVIQGDDQADQGKYLVRLPTVTNKPTLAVPTGAGQSRRDVLTVVVRDPDAGGAAGSDALLRWVQGTPTTGTPTTPAIPVDSIALAYITLTNTSTSVTAGMINSSLGVAANLGAVRNFATRAARATAIPTPTLGQVTTLDTWPGTLHVWDGTGWKATQTGFANLSTDSSAVAQLNFPQPFNSGTPVYIVSGEGTAALSVWPVPVYGGVTLTYGQVICRASDPGGSGTIVAIANSSAGFHWSATGYS